MVATCPSSSYCTVFAMWHFLSDGCPSCKDSGPMPETMLVPLPPQAPAVRWPTPDPDGWPLGSAPPQLDKLVDDLVSDEDRYGTTYAVLVIHEGRLLLERYDGELPHFDRRPEPVTPE